MINIKTLLPELRTLVTDLAEDLLARSTADDKIDAGLRDAFRQIEKGGRTAQAFEVWRDDYLDQVAVAWVLACVFVRFMEDNHLIDECWLAGEGDRRNLAEGAHELFFRKHPHNTDREYFEHVFREVGKIPAAKELFAEGKTPLWAVGPSGDAAMKLLAFWREIDPETGDLKRRFNHETHETHEKKTERKDKRTGEWGGPPSADSSSLSSFSCVSCVSWFDPARFLGDLYQDLSEKARKKYALLQTPVFVEEFILDRTLTPALDEFGLEKVRLIDPTCGSGHFLLGAFARLFDLWSKRESNEIKAAQKALDGVWGVDINPFAVAIARFRLIVAAVQACGIKRLKQAPGWTIHLAAGDSLVFGSKPGWKGERTLVSQQGNLFEVDPIYAVEDRQAVNQILGQGYHVVVGNPPYIIVRDRKLNSAYRELYSTCHQKYSLGVPFTQRFWELALQPGEANGGCGHVGMITANSFMKREFGKKLIEEFFPKIDLKHVIDTSGAYIPGHGTPTVILLGRSRKPAGDTVRAVLGIKGEPTTPDDASQGYVWLSIVRHIDIANAQDEYISTADVPRTTFNAHPWSIGGGGAADVIEAIEASAEKALADHADTIGIVCFTLADEVYILPKPSARRKGISQAQLREMIVGSGIRDWIEAAGDALLFPYDGKLRPIAEDIGSSVFRYLWMYRSILSNSKMFGGKTKVECGLQWFEYGRLTASKLLTPLFIVFANIATHNHFVLDRGGKLFDTTAPIIKLPSGATSDEHLALLGLLNSSTACFWIKQRFQTKGSSGMGRGIYDERWEFFYQISGTGMEAFPVCEGKPLATARQLDKLARDYTGLMPAEAMQAVTPTVERLADARTQSAVIRGRMIALQEELDWQCYQLYGLLADDVRYMGDDVPELALGQRAFEIVMARQMVKGDLQTSWFERHGSTPITEIPSHWSAAYRKLVERRIKLIETNKDIALIEKPECKRRWNAEAWEQQEQQALGNWLLDCLERQSHGSTPELTTVARLADKASGNAEFMQVAALYRGRPDFDVAALVAELVEGEAVPFLPVLRYKPTGLRKREIWERTYSMQREEDRTTKHTKHTKKDKEEEEDADAAGESSSDFFRVFRVFRGLIPVPPKYTSTDFQKTDYWRLRGKLDVPKERWVSYPHCQTESDPSLVIGWAGWNHLEQATALVGYYDARKREGWDAKRLMPLLAGLDQLLPWIHQWHPEVDKEFGETAGQSFQIMLEHDAHELGLTLEDIRNWKPENKPRNTRNTRKKKGESS